MDRWGDQVAPDGRVDRDKVGEIVFGDRDELAWLESVTHPRVGAHVAEWRQSLEPDVDVAVVEVPLLFEAAMEDAFDTTVAVIADDELRDARLRERGQAGLEGREERQLDQAEKEHRADHVIRNDSSLVELDRGERSDREAAQGGRLMSQGTSVRSARTRSRASGNRSGSRGRARTKVRSPRSRRALVVGGSLVVVALGGFLLVNSGRFQRTLEEVTLPLQHEDIIRQQAAEKDVPPDLIAAVIYTESRFRDQTSHAGARGLMQITPGTAQLIERRAAIFSASGVTAGIRPSVDQQSMMYARPCVSGPPTPRCRRGNVALAAALPTLVAAAKLCSHAVKFRPLGLGSRIWGSAGRVYRFRRSKCPVDRVRPTAFSSPGLVP